MFPLCPIDMHRDVLILNALDQCRPTSHKERGRVKVRLNVINSLKLNIYKINVVPSSTGKS